MVGCALADEASFQLLTMSRDIVDVKHINTEVESIFKGPITRSNDEKAS